MGKAKHPPSRSLLAGLPFDLKTQIRTQTLDSHPDNTEDSVEIKAELIAINDLLPTQPDSSASASSSSSSPSSSSSSSSSSADVEITVVETTAPIASSSKRTIDVVDSPTQKYDVSMQGSYEPYEPPEPLPPPKKITQRTRGPRNPFHGHPWDCSGLVHRYTRADQVPSDLKKYYSQRHLYFPRYDELPIILDETGWYSVTPQPIAAHIADRCRCDVVIDAFCGVGGNSIEFARTCERVIAIDNNPTRLRLARHNALHHGVADRIEFILADFTQYARAYVERHARTGEQGEEIDVVFLSPPWGGPDYLDRESYPLSAISPLDGTELFNLSAALTPNIGYYLPRNVAVDEVASLAHPLDQVEANEDGREREKEWVELEEEWVGEKMKAVTAYFGGLVTA